MEVETVWIEIILIRGQCATDLAKTIATFISSEYGMLNADAISKYLGVTPMIGKNDVAGETFPFTDLEKFVKWVGENKLNQLSFWSLTRDYPGTTGGLGNSATHSKQQMDNILKNLSKILLKVQQHHQLATLI